MRIHRQDGRSAQDIRKLLSKSAPVVCIDEKPVVLHEDTLPMIPMQPGQHARRDYE
jgi:hypothetical protein